MKKFYADIVDPKIDEYISNLYGESTGIFKEMEEYAAKNEVPIIGPLVGRLLSQICLIKQPSKIFELGSGFGYSALWFAISLPDNATVICSDFAEEKSKLAKSYFEKAGVHKKIDFKVGNSLNILKETEENFDIIFNDVDKDFYPKVIDIACEKLNYGGLLISDNVLWYGRVTGDDGLQSTNGIKNYNNNLFSNTAFLSTIVPLRDGVSLSVKI